MAPFRSVPGLTLPSGQPAQLFSSRNAKTVRRHFSWLRQHGLPGVFLQRFVSEVAKPEEGMRALRDQVGRNVRAAAEAEGRVWAVMWDVSGTPADEIEEAILADWQHMVRRAALLLPAPALKLTQLGAASPSHPAQVENEHILRSPSYLHEGGKPCLVIWGLGFADRDHDAQTMIRLVRRLRESVEGGIWLMAGTPSTSSRPHLLCLQPPPERRR